MDAQRAEDYHRLSGPIRKSRDIREQRGGSGDSEIVRRFCFQREEELL